ncbi:MAG TPA: hypothetical protein VI111_03215 [Thermoleophilaceae bacterium]
MSPSERTQALRRVGELRARRRARVVRIRQVVAALALACFVALFSTIYVQMAAGRDPVLGASAASHTSGSTSRSAGSVSDSVGDAGAASGDDSGASASGAVADSATSSGQSSAVTTSQS